MHSADLLYSVCTSWRPYHMRINTLYLNNNKQIQIRISVRTAPSTKHMHIHPLFPFAANNFNVPASEQSKAIAIARRVCALSEMCQMT